jgi:HEAT repeat protein
VPSGIEITLNLLTRTDNESAVPVLIAALDSPDPAIQEGALVAMLHRRNPAGGREILDRLPRMKPDWKAIVRQYHGRLTQTLRDAILGSDSQLCENGCRATVLFRDYDLIPTLLSALEDPNHPKGDLVVSTVVELVESLYDELAGGRDPSDRRDPQVIRRYVVAGLEQSVQRFGHQHRRREVIESFLTLVGRENVTLRQVLQNPHHPAFAPIVEMLAKSTRRGVIRLLLTFLDDVRESSAMIALVSGRSDVQFIHYLLKKIGREPSLAVAQNLKRIDSIPWLTGDRRLLEQLDDASQHALVRLVVTASIPRQQAYAMVEQVLLHGKPGGRQEAARALAEFHGADANALAVRATEDPDPHVLANLVPQLRGRGIPGILPRLLEMVQSPYEVVRRAAKESLAEFNFKRFLASFDLMDEEVRRSTGLLVKKIDSQTVPLLKEELKSPIRTRRIRGLVITRNIDAVADVEAEVVALLDDEDHMVRLEAVSVLTQATTESSSLALRRAMADKSEMVREAARCGLEQQAEVQ